MDLTLGYYWVIKDEKQPIERVARLGKDGWNYEEGVASVKMIGGVNKPWKIIERIESPSERPDVQITAAMVQDAYDMGRFDGVQALGAVLSRDHGVPFEEISMDFVDGEKKDGN